MKMRWQRRPGGLAADSIYCLLPTGDGLTTYRRILLVLTQSVWPSSAVSSALLTNCIVWKADGADPDDRRRRTEAEGTSTRQYQIMNINLVIISQKVPGAER